MSDVVAAGLFTLSGVVAGALLAPLTQLFLEWNRDRLAANRAKKLVAGEMLHAQLILRTAATTEKWLYTEDMAAARALLPSSSWEENRHILVGHIDEDLMDKLVMAYAALEVDRLRFVNSGKVEDKRVTPTEAESLRQASRDLWRLRRKLGAGSGWPDELAPDEVAEEAKPPTPDAE